MTTCTLKSIKPGTFFKRKADAQTVFVKGAYDRTDKKFECSDWGDINRFVYLKGSTTVYVDFTF